MLGKEKSQPQKDDEWQPPKKPALVIRIFRALKHQYNRARRKDNEAGTEHQRNERMLAVWTRRLGIWTIVLGTAGIISAVTFGLQYRAMLTANKENRQAFTSAQRAFLFVSDITAVPTVNNSGQPTIRVFPKWTNSGETPTLNLRMLSLCKRTAEELDFKGAPNENPDIIGPKQTKADGNCDFTPPTPLILKSGVIGQFSIGVKAVYYDVFNRRQKHISEFCATFPVVQVYNPQDGTIRMNATNTFEYCPHHNCADDECPAEDR